MSNNLMNHVLMNKLDDELSIAIQSVGGDVSGAKGPWDYPEIIKNQLSANCSCENGLKDFTLGPGLKVEDAGCGCDKDKKILFATSDALMVGALNPPTGSYMQRIGKAIPVGTSIQSVFETLFYDILPKMPSLYKGDVIVALPNGTDQYNEEDLKTGLTPGDAYLRLYVANRQEPIYISLKAVQGSGGTSTSDLKIVGSEFINVTSKNNVVTISLAESITDEVNELDTRLTENEKLISSISKALEDIDVDELKSIVESIKNLNIDELTSKLNTLESQINILETSVNSKASQSDLDKLSNDVEDIRSQIEQGGGSGEDLTEIYSRLNVIETDLVAKADKKDVATKSELQEVQQSINEVEQSVNDIRAEVNNSVEEINTRINSEVQDLQQEIQSIEPGLSNDEVNTVVESYIIGENNTVLKNTIEQTVVHELNNTEGSEIQTVVEQIVNDIIVEKVTSPDNVLQEDEAVEGVDELFQNI